MEIGDDGLAVQDISKINAEELTPLTPEVMSRQVGICADTPLRCPFPLANSNHS
jgi:hypothetical protein